MECHILHEDQNPNEKLADVTRTHTMHLEAILRGALSPLQKANRLKYASNNFAMALEGILAKHTTH